MTTIADKMGAKARKLPNGSVDQAIKYERTKRSPAHDDVRKLENRS
jgi:hypothetical protein